MTGIRLHGRGGQGAVIASRILAQAYFKQGLFVQSFPSFGMERRGAAVAAYVRKDSSPILERGEILNPSISIVLDTRLLDMIDVTEGVLPGGTILINSRDNCEAFDFAQRYRVATVDANRISVNNGLGSKTAPIVNTVILGAFARLEDELDFENVLSAIREMVPQKVDQNIAAAREAYDEVALPPGDINE